jgi:hypothetical protein
METIVSIFGLGTTNDLYVVSAFFHLSDYYLRLQCSLVPFLRRNRFRVVVHYIPSADEINFVSAILCFMEDSFSTPERESVDETNRAHRIPMQLTATKRLFAVWVGGFKQGEK